MERLKAEVTWWQKASDTGRVLRERDKAVAEVERLKREVKDRDARIDWLANSDAEREAEVERLKEENRQRGFAKVRARIEAALAEAEALLYGIRQGKPYSTLELSAQRVVKALKGGE